MRQLGILRSVVLVVAFAAVIGCGADKKPDDGAPPPDPKGKNPDGVEPGVLPPAPGEPKFKIKSEDFIKEYKNTGRGANAKYNGAIVELTGNVTRAAGVELDSLGTPVGQAGDYKASFVLGEADANRADTVIVRGLKTTAVGTVLRGQKVTVKGRVARYQQPNPVELLDAELISPGADESVSLNNKDWGGEMGREKLEVGSAKVTGTVVERGNDGGEYLVITGENVTKMRCYLMDGIGALFPSGFPAEKKIRLAGTLKYESLDKDNPTASRVAVLRDCVPLDRDPKAK